MEEKIIKIFESKLERLKDIEFPGKTLESGEINLLLEYWRDIVVTQLQGREKLLKDMLKDKEENFSMLDIQLNSLKMEVKQMEDKNAQLKNDIQIQKLVLEKEKIILENSYKDRFEEKLKKKELEFKDREIELEKLKLEKENLEYVLVEKTERLKSIEKEYCEYKQNMEIALRKKEGQIEELEKAKKDLEETIELIASSKVNMWAREEKTKEKIHSDDFRRVLSGTVDRSQVLKEKIKALEKENEEFKNKLETRKNEIVKEYERKAKEDAQRQAAEYSTRKKEMLTAALKDREELYRNSLGNLGSGFAVRLRNFFTIFNGIIQICQADCKTYKETPKKFIKKLNKKKYSAIDELLENFKTLRTNLIKAEKDLQDFYKITHFSAHHMHTQCLNLIMEEVCFNLDDQCESANISFLKNFDENIPDFLLDKGLIENAFYQIITNAIESMPEGGDLTVQTEFQKDSENAVVKISDTGEGISEQNFSRVFQLFYSTKKEKKGLGLPIAQRYIEIHLGNIEIEKKKGNKGITVTVILPVITS